MFSRPAYPNLLTFSACDLHLLLLLYPFHVTDLCFQMFLVGIENDKWYEMY